MRSVSVVAFVFVLPHAVVAVFHAPLVIGDGLIPGGRQVFTQLAGFPASPSGGGSNRLPRLIVDGVEVVHIEAPSRIAELTEHIIRLAPDWIP